LCNATNAAIIDKFVALNAYLRKEDKEYNNQISTPRKLQKIAI
jgi:hypothetical protein